MTFPIESSPIAPDADTAQSWVVEELSRSEYHASYGLLHRFVARILDSFFSLFGSGSGEFAIGDYVLLAFFTLLLALVIVAVINPVRLRNRRSSEVFEDDDFTLNELQRRTVKAATEGLWDDAIVWGMRTYALTLNERHLVRVSPGLTAQEVARHAGKRLEHHRASIAKIAAVFDGVRYGTAHATSGDYESLAALISDASLQHGGSK